MNGNGEDTTGLLDEQGALLNRAGILLSPTEAQLLRLYKRFLMSHGLKEALYCNRCFHDNRYHGMRAEVTDHDVLIECRCRRLTYTGLTI